MSNSTSTRKVTVHARLDALDARLDGFETTVGSLIGAVDRLVGVLAPAPVAVVTPETATTPVVVAPVAPVAPVAEVAEPVAEPEVTPLAEPEPVANPKRVKLTAEQLEARKRANKACAAHLREMGVVPAGSAWKAAVGGERHKRTLLALNAADGLSPKGKATPVAVTPVAEPVAEPVAPAAPEVDVAGLAARLGLSEADVKARLGL